MPRTKKLNKHEAQQRRNVAEGLAPTATMRNQLRRLIAHLKATRDMTVELKRKSTDQYPRLVINRPEHKPVIFTAGHPTERNLDLLIGIAKCARESGGGGMTWDEIRAVCNTANAAVDNVPHAREEEREGKQRAEGSVARVWQIGDSMPKADRKTIIDACVKAGINPATAATQYAKWNKAKRSPANA